MHPDVKNLLAVQEVDQRIAALRKDLISVPREREQRQVKLDALRARVQAASDALQVGQVQVRTSESGIQDADQEIKKLQERLNTVKNNAEYQAILLQIESVRKQISEQEEEGLGFIELVEKHKGELVELEKQLAEEDAIFAEFNTKADVLLQEREGQVAELDVERQQHLGGVPPELLREYERMFEARSHFVVCAVEGETCTGCYMSIPPNLQVKLRAGTAVVRCDSCQRILYYPE